MHDYRVAIAGLNDQQVTFSAETLVAIDADVEPTGFLSTTGPGANPRLAGRDRHEMPPSIRPHPQNG